MHSVGIHIVIKKLISFLYYAGFWHRGDKPTVTEKRMQLFYCIYYSLFSLSLITGTAKCESEGQAIFSVQSSVAAVVLNVKFYFLITKQHQIVDLLNRVCTLSIRCDEDLTFVNKKLGKFAIFVNVFIITAISGSCVMSLSPFFRSEKTSFVEIGHNRICA